MTCWSCPPCANASSSARLVVTNHQSTAVAARVVARVLDADQPVLELGRRELTLEPGQAAPLAFTRPWTDPVLWGPGSAKLYTLAVETRRRGHRPAAGPAARAIRLPRVLGRRGSAVLQRRAGPAERLDLPGRRGRERRRRPMVPRHAVSRLHGRVRPPGEFPAGRDLQFVQPAQRGPRRVLAERHAATCWPAQRGTAITPRSSPGTCRTNGCRFSTMAAAIRKRGPAASRPWTGP